MAEKAVSAEETSRESGGIDERLLVSVSDESSQGSRAVWVTESWLVTVGTVRSDGRARGGEAWRSGAPTFWPEC